ncbi:FtsK-like domain-containing protein [Aquisphaera giovannonii]|uniref:FtsK-like domain-containing protein n=1 Tax=Aquisphaera giovannonii TaxID=406548 RepID=A0A5B9W8Q6_9BACT|nr:DNA translocase FtsK [Aquisphaera giovannonii]QEH36465.1 FtsK-like domain-containing protein [Aquisphaera giovannonii]
MHFDQNKSIGALGTLIVAKWYRSVHQQNLLISLDSAETRRWMNLEEDARRADLLGLSLENNVPIIDVLESKSGVDATSVYSIDGAGKISGKPVEQLVNTGRSVGAIFGLNEWKDHVLTPPRREILRNHLYRQGFTGKRTPQEKQYWERVLNSLFRGETKPVIRLNLILVNLGLNQQPLNRIVESEGSKIRLVHLNEESVSFQLGQPPLSPAVVAREAEPTSSEVDQEVEIEDQSAGLIEPEPAELEIEVSPNLAEQIKTTCGRIKAACQDFGIKVTEIDPEKVDIGPSILRYKIKLAPGEDSARLRRQAENIARQLAASSVPIIGFLIGTNFEYLDLARPDRQVVSLEPHLKSVALRDVNELPLHVGVDPAGSQYRLDLGDDRLPHMLVAGGTGSGKTIFLYSVVLSLVTAHTSKTLELVIIDPKQTDFTVFGGLPHLRNGEIIIDADRGVEAVKAIAEHDMQERSELLQKAKCRDIKAYNLANPKKIIRPLVVVIDEYADLVSVLSKKERDDFERVISRITARGRNVGIHLILATQRPTADVVTGNIKANMAARISFSLPSSRDSLVILDEPGAERLLRNGDMLLLLEGRLTRLQGYYVDPARLEKLIPKR